jgi:hypothetical protein
MVFFASLWPFKRQHQGLTDQDLPSDIKGANHVVIDNETM